ncbi:tRNA 2-selenouridine(34) synthase MnmH [Rheinheimera baltica]|uniref:tRNA 2-selenouridine synthase n=1 Tax=Rheinheimera baltica TaxID=67576 RepID=A0ABT9I171_9GAMM|nr:tRNA 2-selenouridine(34) synthase MnmH [Rheinheimera baltica]MDP5137140.1 tRNA 2-selenouridine(34) synthase MnmH [Rheinheimera baltica]MDP5142983.1 tRNA 2-selenouridine(34) synthase MnmH [Rheinheimera baltica]
MSVSLPLSDNYDAILRQRLPLLDVRAPVEFAKGAFSHSQNLPLMNDAERTAVGTCYKQQGQQAAIALGHQLVCGDIKQARIASWQVFSDTHPNGMLYCARGGLRSQIAQQWLADVGVMYPKVKGGFKALRRAAINVIEHASTQPILLLAGPTGSGKTRLLNQLQAIDLEGLANHRGSAFGRKLSPQPTQICFEHDLASAILQLQHPRPAYLLLEDESLLIGQRNIPHPLYQSMQRSPILLLEEPLAVRVEVILQDYIVNLFAEALQHDAEQGFTVFADMLQQGLARISKRLGGVLFSELQQLLNQALELQRTTADISLHRIWIQRLLSEYYDPMYHYQLQKRNLPILLRGDATTLLSWWRQHGFDSRL